MLHSWICDQLLVISGVWIAVRECRNASPLSDKDCRHYRQTWASSFFYAGAAIEISINTEAQWLHDTCSFWLKSDFGDKDCNRIAFSPPADLQILLQVSIRAVRKFRSELSLEGLVGCCESNSFELEASKVRNGWNELGR